MPDKEINKINQIANPDPVVLERLEKILHDVKSEKGKDRVVLELASATDSELMGYAILIGNLLKENGIQVVMGWTLDEKEYNDSDFVIDLYMSKNSPQVRTLYAHRYWGVSLRSVNHSRLNSQSNG